MRLAIAPTAARVDKPAPRVSVFKCVDVGFPPRPLMMIRNDGLGRHTLLGDEILHNFGNSGTAKQQQRQQVDSNTVQILQIL